MFKVKMLKNTLYGKKGKIIEMNDWLADQLSREKKIKKIKYLGKYDESPYYIKKRIKSAEKIILIKQEQIKKLNKKLNEVNKKWN